MKHKLRRISPSGLAALLAAFGFLLSFIGIAFVLLAMRPGVTGNLSGFVSFQFKDHADGLILIIYPFANALGGMITGFVIGWLYNLWAGISGGLLVELSEADRWSQL